MDETPRQLIGETPVPAAPGRPTREDYEHRRCGSCNLFMAPRRRAAHDQGDGAQTDWALFLNDIAEGHPGAEAFPPALRFE